MNASLANGTELDLHRLEAPYAQTRLQRPEQVRRLMASIDADGQRVPLVVVGAGERFVLVDGYQRWAALTRLGRDTAQVEVWDGPLSAALAEGLTQRAVATALGKDPSWVSRRLALLSQLSEPLQEVVRQGVLSSWAASRVLVPLARANAAEAEALLGALRQEPLSTRELATWYSHYAQANRTARARLVAHPRLFIQALQSPDTAAPEDPEAQWLGELERLRRQLQRLARTLLPLLDPRPPIPTWEALRSAVAKTAQALERLRQPLQEGEHAVRTATPDHPRAARQGAGRTPDQPHPGTHASHGAPGAPGGRAAPPAPSPECRELARTHLDAARALLRDSGERGADAGAVA